MTRRQKTVVTIGGGTGSFVVLSALKKYPLRLKAIISMADDGGSTGVLRDQYGVLPPGDVRRALIALSDSSDALRALFTYRFLGGQFKGHSFGNLFLSALEKVTGNFAAGVREAARILNVRGEVIPVTTDNIRLHARLVDGKRIRGEANIDISKTKNRAAIHQVWLKPKGRIHPAARQAIASADLIVIGPGDLYTSIIPSFLVSGVPEAIRRSRAKKIYLANIMTKRSETRGFVAADFVREVERYLGANVLDAAIFNTRKPSPALLRRYARQGSLFVDPPKRNDGKKPRMVRADLVDGGELIRHSPKDKLARVILSFLH